MPGTISLFNYAGDFICIKKYRSVKDRYDIMDAWKKMYSKAFLKCFIQISPEVKEEKSPKLRKVRGLTKKTNCL